MHDPCIQHSEEDETLTPFAIAAGYIGSADNKNKGRINFHMQLKEDKDVFTFAKLKEYDNDRIKKGHGSIMTYVGNESIMSELFNIGSATLNEYGTDSFDALAEFYDNGNGHVIDLDSNESRIMNQNEKNLHKMKFT